MVNNLRCFSLTRAVSHDEDSDCSFSFIAHLAVNFLHFLNAFEIQVKFIFSLPRKGILGKVSSLSIKIDMVSYNEHSQRRSFKLIPSHIIYDFVLDSTATYRRLGKFQLSRNVYFQFILFIFRSFSQHQQIKMHSSYNDFDLMKKIIIKKQDILQRLSSLQTLGQADKLLSLHFFKTSSAANYYIQVNLTFNGMVL